MSNAYDYQNDDPDTQQQPPQPPPVYSPLGAPLAALARQVLQAPPSTQAPNYFPYTREALQSDPLNWKLPPAPGYPGAQPPPQPPPQAPEPGYSGAQPRPQPRSGQSIDPYTGEPRYSGPMNIAPGATPPPGYVNVGGQLKAVPRGYDWSKPQLLDPSNARWPIVGPVKPLDYSRTTVDGRPLRPQPQQPPPQPPEPYIPTPANRPPDQWGTPDFVFRGAMKYPGVTPGPLMPQSHEFASLLHGIVMGLGRWGSHYSGMPAIAMGTYASAYWKAYQSGMRERANQSWQQYRQARQMTLDRQKEELQAAREGYALYGKDPRKLHQYFMGLASKYNDQPLTNALAMGPQFVDELMQTRDGHWNTLGKIALQQEKTRAEIERIKAQTELERARLEAIRKGATVIPPDYEDPDTTAPGTDDETGDGDRSDGDRTDGDQTTDGDRTDDEDRTGTGDLQDQGTLGLAAARNKPGDLAGAPPAGTPARRGPRPGLPDLDAQLPGFPGVQLDGSTAPAARPPGSAAGPTTTGQAPGTAAPGPPGAPGRGAYGAPARVAGGPPGAYGATAPVAPDTGLQAGPGGAGTVPPLAAGTTAGAPPSRSGAPPQDRPIGLPPAHFIPPGMTPSQLDFEAQRYYESGKDIYPAKQIAENTAIHRRATQINTFVNRLIDHYRPGIDSEQQLISNIGRADPNLAGALRDILAGGEPLPRAGSGASEYNRLISQLPARIRPGFSGQVYAARQKIANDYAPGGYMGRMMFAENRLAPAALEVVRTARALPQDQARFENVIQNYIKTKIIGDPEYSNFFVAWRAYVSELVRIQRGGTGAEADIQQQIDNIAPSSTLRQILGGLITDARITIPAMNDAKHYWDSMGMGYEMPLYDQRTHDTLDSIMNRLDPETGNFYGTEPSGMRGRFILEDPITHKRRLYIGHGDPNTDRDPANWIAPAERLPGR